MPRILQRTTTTTTTTMVVNKWAYTNNGWSAVDEDEDRKYHTTAAGNATKRKSDFNDDEGDQIPFDETDEVWNRTNNEAPTRLNGDLAWTLPSDIDFSQPAKNNNNNNESSWSAQNNKDPLGWNLTSDIDLSRPASTTEREDNDYGVIYIRRKGDIGSSQTSSSAFTPYSDLGGCFLEKDFAVQPEITFMPQGENKAEEDDGVTLPFDEVGPAATTIAAAPPPLPPTTTKQKKKERKQQKRQQKEMKKRLEYQQKKLQEFEDARRRKPWGCQALRDQNVIEGPSSVPPPRKNKDEPSSDLNSLCENERSIPTPKKRVRHRRRRSSKKKKKEVKETKKLDIKRRPTSCSPDEPSNNTIFPLLKKEENKKNPSPIKSSPSQDDSYESEYSYESSHASSKKSGFFKRLWRTTECEDVFCQVVDDFEPPVGGGRGPEEMTCSHNKKDRMVSDMICCCWLPEGVPSEIPILSRSTKNKTRNDNPKKSTAKHGSRHSPKNGKHNDRDDNSIERMGTPTTSNTGGSSSQSSRKFARSSGKGIWDAAKGFLLGFMSCSSGTVLDQVEPSEAGSVTMSL